MTLQTSLGANAIDGPELLEILTVELRTALAWEKLLTKERDLAREELDQIDRALGAYSIPSDVCIGRNSTADKVTWLIRRLQGTERTLEKIRTRENEL